MAAASILKPSRINSLGRTELRIVEHIHGGEPNVFTIEAYPFERILSIKQRISLHFSAEKNVTHLPAYIFMARKTGDMYTPIERKESQMLG